MAPLVPSVYAPPLPFLNLPTTPLLNLPTTPPPSQSSKPAAADLERWRLELRRRTPGATKIKVGSGEKVGCDIWERIRWVREKRPRVDGVHLHRRAWSRWEGGLARSESTPPPRRPLGHLPSERAPEACASSEGVCGSKAPLGCLRACHLFAWGRRGLGAGSWSLLSALSSSPPALPGPAG